MRVGWSMDSNGTQTTPNPQENLKNRHLEVVFQTIRILNIWNRCHRERYLSYPIENGWKLPMTTPRRPQGSQAPWIFVRPVLSLMAELQGTSELKNKCGIHHLHKHRQTQVCMYNYVHISIIMCIYKIIYAYYIFLWTPLRSQPVSHPLFFGWMILVRSLLSTTPMSWLVKLWSKLWSKWMFLLVTVITALLKNPYTGHDNSLVVAWPSPTCL